MRSKTSEFAGLCKAATLKEIETQGWSLNPGRYVGVGPRRGPSAMRISRNNSKPSTEELETLNGQAREFEANHRYSVRRRFWKHEKPRPCQIRRRRDNSSSIARKTGACELMCDWKMRPSG